MRVAFSPRACHVRMHTHGGRLRAGCGQVAGRLIGLGHLRALRASNRAGAYNHGSRCVRHSWRGHTRASAHTGHTQAAGTQVRHASLTLVAPDFGRDAAGQLGVGARHLALGHDLVLELIRELVVLIALFDPVHRGGLEEGVGSQPRLHGPISYSPCRHHPAHTKAHVRTHAHTHTPTQ